MYYVPQQHMPAAQFAPQGWFGDQVSHYAPVLGGALGGLTTQITKSPSLGGLAGGIATTVARDYGQLLPFQAGPMAAHPAAYAPQGFWGNMISGVGGAVGNVVGGNTGNIIRDASGLARYLPFDAGPMSVAPQPAAYDPQGIFGRIGGGLLGGAIGGAFGNRGLGSAIGGAVGNFLPFEAGPMGVPQAAYGPQGFWGDMISNVGGAVGGVVGGNTGNIIRDASGLARYLPFDAGPMSVAPQQAAYDPQGIFGRIGGGLLGGAIGGAFGNRGLGSAIGGAVGNFLPFEAGPMGVPQAAYAPQGFWGNMISGVGGAVGNVVGGNTGNIIRDASGLARYLPFNAGPMSVAQPAAYDPQGIFGSIGGGLLGGAIGGAFGNRGLGSAIGGAVGAFLPFQAGPGQPIQYIPVADVQAAAAAHPQNAPVVYL